MLLDIRNCTKPLPSIRVIFMVHHHDYKEIKYPILICNHDYSFFWKESNNHLKIALISWNLLLFEDKFWNNWSKVIIFIFIFCKLETDNFITLRYLNNQNHWLLRKSNVHPMLDQTHNKVKMNK
jgi:hypothetical protein